METTLAFKRRCNAVRCEHCRYRFAKDCKAAFAADLEAGRASADILAFFRSWTDAEIEAELAKKEV